MRRLEHKSDGDVAAVLLFFGAMTIIFGTIGAWATHVVWIIKTLASDKGATVGQVILGFIGTFFPPVGVVHGVMIWTGAS